jgi:DNA repair protein RecN (Recombination protein N)
MQELAMEGGVLEIDVQLEADAKPSLRGDDRIALRVSANRDAEPGPLRKVASGGELSRISLAIKIASRREEGSDTQVFDEVDAGIGGATATTVGSLLKRLAAGGQALCVTHLAQVAVFADCQLQVQKATDDGSTRVAARALALEERVNEVARMLGGQLSDSSRAHAAELLGEAQSVRH